MSITPKSEYNPVLLQLASLADPDIEGSYRIEKVIVGHGKETTHDVLKRIEANVARRSVTTVLDPRDGRVWTVTGTKEKAAA
jgi:hypothetical protein